MYRNHPAPSLIEARAQIAAQRGRSVEGIVPVIRPTDAAIRANDQAWRVADALGRVRPSFSQ